MPKTTKPITVNDCVQKNVSISANFHSVDEGDDSLLFSKAVIGKEPYKSARIDCKRKEIAISKQLDLTQLKDSIKKEDYKGIEFFSFTIQLKEKNPPKKKIAKKKETPKPDKVPKQKNK